MALPTARPHAEPELLEFTLRAAVVGIALGLVFGAANAYLGLRVGLTISASIPASVMTVAAFRVFRARPTLLEANLSQTIGSASTALATGSIFTLPALFLWGAAPPYLEVVALCFLGGLLGLAAMIPLRRLLIAQSAAELPYPEGTACAEVLRTLAQGSSQADAGRFIFTGMGLGAAVKLLVSLAFLVPASLSLALPVLPKAELALELAPALVAVGFILGYRQSGIIVAGALISSIVLIPLLAWLGADVPHPVFPETVRLVSQMSAQDLWSRYVRYIGAGAVAVAGIATVLRGLPTMVSAFAAVARGLRTAPGTLASGLGRTDRDLPPVFVVGAILVVPLVCLVPGVFAGDLPLGPRALCALGVAFFGILFVAVASRIVGLVGVSSQPTSGITLVTLLGTAAAFAALGWRSAGAKLAVLTVGTVVAIAASKAGDISQDLKTGSLLGATPARQQLGQLLGAAFACWAVAATVLLLGKAYTFGSRDLPAPQATLMKTIIEGVLSGQLPWGLVLTGGGLSIGAMLCGISGLAFAIGVYLPLSAMAPIYLGGCVRAWVDRAGRAAPRGENLADAGVLAASGLVAGEGLAGVLIAGLVALGLAPKDRAPLLPGVAGELGTALLVAGIAWFLLRAGRTAKPPQAVPRE